jgi:hypothetical protein
MRRTGSVIHNGPMRTIILSLFFITAASAQIFSAGIKAGIPLTDPFENLTFPSPFTTGPDDSFLQQF